MFTCFGGPSRKTIDEDAVNTPHRFSQATSSMESSQDVLGPINKLASMLKTGTSSKHCSPRMSQYDCCKKQSSSDMKDYQAGRWTGSSSGSSSVKSIGMSHRMFYNLQKEDVGKKFMNPSELAQVMRQQSEAHSDNLDSLSCLSMSGGALEPAPSWGMNTWEIDADEVQICLDSWSRPWQLGTGGFGKVFKAEMAGSTPVAVKFVNRQNPRELRRFIHEIGILRSLRHQNIVQFMGAFLEGGQMILVTEYMVGGDLFDVIGHDLQQEFSWYKRGHQVALDVTRGLVHMHHRRIIHLDLKSANILLARDGTAKIADVGLAKVLSRECTQAHMQSTFDWAAPEVLAGQTCSDKADIWSLGVVLWEIASGEAPKLRQLRPLNAPEECPAGLRDLIVACRASNPEDRPAAKEVFKRLSAIVADHQSVPLQMANSQIGQTTTSLHSGDIFRPSQRPAWASREHYGEEEGPSFMAAIYEDHDRMLSSNGEQGLNTGNALRKCTLDLSGRAWQAGRRLNSRERRSSDQFRSSRSTSL